MCLSAQSTLSFWRFFDEHFSLHAVYSLQIRLLLASSFVCFHLRIFMKYQAWQTNSIWKQKPAVLSEKNWHLLRHPLQSIRWNFASKLVCARQGTSLFIYPDVGLYRLLTVAVRLLNHFDWKCLSYRLWETHKMSSKIWCHPLDGLQGRSKWLIRKLDALSFDRLNAIIIIV